MYKLVIADDESMIRKGLSNSINWKELGFELVACFEDGTDILEYVKTHPVDVILSDIVMCNISGLDVAKKIYEDRLPIKIILMSGYQDFKFAHDAIRYQVFDYLLKPIANTEIIKKFKLLKDVLDINNNVKLEQSKKDNEISECISDMQAILMKRIWNCQYLDKRIIQLISSAINLELSNEDNLVVFMFQCVNRNDTVKELIKTRQKDLWQIKCLISIIDDGHILGVLYDSKKSDENKQIRNALELLSDENHSFLFVKKKHISLQTNDVSMETKDIIEFIKNAVLYLQSLDKSESISDFSLELPNYLENDFKVQILRLVMEIFVRRLNSVGISDDLFQHLFDNFKIDTEIKNTLEFLYNKLVDIQNGPFNDNYDFAIEKVRRYIKSHLHEDISVNALAEMVHLNSAYFGRYFKKVTFMSVRQYIYENRMKLAIELLAQKKYTVVEIAKIVGYDFKYFFPLFKKYTGYTPKEYLKYFID